ncbi:MAG: hypothetical protein NC908_03580, partial [Candidatus Omnitrophica bacterium]|nr:hypothetical protein [Candidatus Omnitrophota bacterium]
QKVLADSQKETESFRSYLDLTKSKFTEKYNALMEELALLRERNRLAELANVAIVEGKRKALEELENFVKDASRRELIEVAQAEIMRIKAFYATTNPLKGQSITYNSPSGMVILDDKIPTSTLILELRQNPDWRLRAKFAELLAKRKEPGVEEALLGAMRNDQRLEVVKVASESFCMLTGCRLKDIFDWESAKEWIDKDD